MDQERNAHTERTRAYFDILARLPLHAARELVMELVADEGLKTPLEAHGLDITQTSLFLAAKAVVDMDRLNDPPDFTPTGRATPRRPRLKPLEDQ
jgi:hypothetical protein